MKKLFLTLCLAFTLLPSLKADQLAYISKAEAQRTIALLSKYPEVLVWCACCDTEYSYWSLIKIKKIYMREVGYTDSSSGENYYEVIVEGVNHRGEKVAEELDLAYAHVRGDDGWGYCVGRLIGAECDPCTPPFPWLLDAQKPQKKR